MKDQRDDHVAEQDADQTVADGVEVPGRLEALDHAHVEGERDLHAGVRDARAAEKDPPRDGRARGDEQHERGDRFHGTAVSGRNTRFWIRSPRDPGSPLAGDVATMRRELRLEIGRAHV